MTAEYDLLLHILRCQLNGEPCVLPKDADLFALAEVARKHRLEPFLFAAAQDTPMEESLFHRLSGVYHRSHFRDAQFDHAKSLITAALSEHGIEHIFMRGIAIKHAYPDPALRTMSDVDVLVHSRDLPKLRKALKQVDCQLQPGDGNHRNYLFPPGIKVEFHPMLLHSSSPVATDINPGWQYVPEGQDGFCKHMSPEGFYLNVMCHFANHFFSGGAGIRFVMDLWICDHCMPPLSDPAFVEQELKRVGIWGFAQNVRKLSEIWFSGAPMDASLAEMAEYICSSGIHGRDDRAMLNAICFSPKKNHHSALLKKVFYPRGDLENRYDWVQGRPWLLWLAWLVRVWNVLTRRLSMVFHWRKGTKRFTREQIAQQQALLLRFNKENT